MFFKVKGTRLFLCGCLFLSSHSISYAQEWESDFPLCTTSISSNSKTATSSTAHQLASEEFVREQQALEQKHADERSDILWQPHTLSDVRRNRIIANHNSLEQRLAQKMELEDYLSSLDEVNLTTGTSSGAGDGLPKDPKQAPLDKGDSTLTALAHSSPNVESGQIYPTATSTNSNQNNTVLGAHTKAQPNPQALNSSGSNQGSHSAPVPNKGSVLNPSQSTNKSTNPRANHNPSYSSSSSSSSSSSVSMSTNKRAIYHSSTLSSALKADRASSLESTSEGMGHGQCLWYWIVGPHLFSSHSPRAQAL